MSLSAEKQKLMYDEIVYLYDLQEKIIDAIEEPDRQQEKCDLAMPFIEQMKQATNVLVKEYNNYIDSGQNASKQSMQAVQNAVRKVFATAAELIKVFEAMPSSEVGVIDEVALAVVERKSPILISLKELVLGPTHKAFTKLAAKLHWLRKLILALRDTCDHFFQIVYTLAYLPTKNPLVQEPGTLMRGRAIPDAQAKAIRERLKNQDLGFQAI